MKERIMGSERRRGFIVAVVLAICLAGSGIADAASLLALDGPAAALREQPGLLDQGVSWLADLWSDFKAVFAADTTGSGPVTPQTCPPETPNCTDAGPGIDPEG
jgi:hypothetical protein